MLSGVAHKFSRLFKKLFGKKATRHEIGMRFVEMIIKSRSDKPETICCDYVGAFA